MKIVVIRDKYTKQKVAIFFETEALDVLSVMKSVLLEPHCYEIFQFVDEKETSS